MTDKLIPIILGGITTADALSGETEIRFRCRGRGQLSCGQGETPISTPIQDVSACYTCNPLEMVAETMNPDTPYKLHMVTPGLEKYPLITIKQG